MGGANIQCGTFEGNDKSASPIVSVLEEAFARAFGRKPRGRIRVRLAGLMRRPVAEDEAIAEAAILEVKFSEEGEIPPAVARRLLPYLESYQAALLQQLNIPDDVDRIWEQAARSTRAKYGTIPDPGWHLYCLHDLVPACRISAADGIPVQVLW